MLIFHGFIYCALVLKIITLVFFLSFWHLCFFLCWSIIIQKFLWWCTYVFSWLFCFIYFSPKVYFASALRWFNMNVFSCSFCVKFVSVSSYYLFPVWANFVSDISSLWPVPHYIALLSRTFFILIVLLTLPWLWCNL